MAKWPQGPCRAYLSPAYTVRLVEADIGMLGLKDAVLFPSDLIDHVAEAYFLMAARKVCSIRSMYGVLFATPLKNVRPLSPVALEWRETLLLGNFAMFAEYTATPCMEKNWRKGWKQRTSNHRRYRFAGEAEWFAWWLRPMREQPEKNHPPCRWMIFC